MEGLESSGGKMEMAGVTHRTTGPNLKNVKMKKASKQNKKTEALASGRLIRAMGLRKWGASDFREGVACRA